MTKNSKKTPDYTNDSKLPCPDCMKEIHVGTGGLANLNAHRQSKQCRKQAHFPDKVAKPRGDRSLHDFFKKPSATVLSSAVQPALIQHVPTDTLATGDATCSDLGDGAGSQLCEPLKPTCVHAEQLMETLQEVISNQGTHLPVAKKMNALAIFAQNPENIIVEGVDDWEDTLNPMLHRAFGYGTNSETASPELLKTLAVRGEYGVDAFYEFVNYFVQYRGLSGSLLEPKVQLLIKAIEAESTGPRTSIETRGVYRSTSDVTLVVDGDEDLDDDVVLINNPALHPQPSPSNSNPNKRPCNGIIQSFPAGQDGHTSYPFALHHKQCLPWNYRSVDDKFYLQSKACRKVLVDDGQWECKACEEIRAHNIFQGIQRRIENGINENTNFAYHSFSSLLEVINRKSHQVDALRLTKLNDNRKPAGKVAALEDHKQWIMAIASGKVDRVAPLVRAALKNRAGIRGLIHAYEKAALQLYRPRGYDEEDMMRSIVMLRLGGARVAEFAHRSLSLPSVSMARRNLVMQPLTISPSMPSVPDIMNNLQLYLEATSKVAQSRTRHGGHHDQQGRQRITHQVLMFDEIAVEKRLRWDDKGNTFLGLCREHSPSFPLEFTSKRELDLICEGLDHDDVHLASEATVGALGSLSEDPHEYTIRPILLSGTCKREDGQQHAKLISTVLTAIERTKEDRGLTYRTICIASDGEAKRGDALVRLTMSKTLDPLSPLYPLLSKLSLLNDLVGPDDLTADKDFKHIFKRQRNLLMRAKGVLIEGFCITPAILHGQLQSNGVSSPRLRSLLNPNDKQDVVLAYSLLNEIWNLPPTTERTDPVFIQAQKALRIYGVFSKNLIHPYICVDMDLSEQLVCLSAAAHLAFYLYIVDKAGNAFMPVQSYVDIIIMIKNVFYCVAKTKVDTPDGKFFLILLGSDRLEKLFGLIRTAVGTDANVDLLQLGTRASGLTEVAAILALHPEWDRGPRRLNLRAISIDSGIDDKTDHISPASWKGDVSVAGVNLHTCWLLGLQRASELVPNMATTLAHLSDKDNIDMLAPFGTLLVNQHEDDDNDEPEPDDANTLEPSDAYGDTGDVEDAMAEEQPRGPGTAKVLVNGQETTKPKAIRARMLYRSTRSSTDRLKRVQEVPCFAPDESDIVTFDSQIGGPCLRVGNPAATLIQCERQIFLAIVQINRLQFASDRNLQALGLHLLADPSVKVDFQILSLVPTTVDDDPTRQHDWRWSLKMDGQCEGVQGRFLHAINPTISIQKPGEPTYLFESQVLITMAATFFQELQMKDIRNIPLVKRSDSFPYRCEGKACFVCEHEGDTRDAPESNHTSPCSHCGAKTQLSLENGQRVLEHMAAHIIHDPSVDTSNEPCGLCLRPAPICVIYLKQRRGAFFVDMTRSSCINLVRFKYPVAAQSSENSPSSNVPKICPLCPKDHPAVWSYNFPAHFRRKHNLLSPHHFPVQITISESEKDGLRRIWNARYKWRSTRQRGDRKRPALMISEAHSARLALRNSHADNAPEADEGDSDLDLVFDQESTTDHEVDNEPDFDNIHDSDDELPDVILPNSDSTSCVQIPISSPTIGSDYSPSGDLEASPSNQGRSQPTSHDGNPHAESHQSTVPSPVQVDLVQPEIATAGRGQRKRKPRTIELRHCECGVEVSQAEIDTGDTVMKCRVAGCETIWFHRACMKYDFAPKNWTCPACKAAQTTNKRRRI